MEGPWEFSLEVNKKNAGTIVKEINDVDEKGLGLASVTKTPFEVTVDDGQPNNADYFTVALDADGVFWIMEAAAIPTPLLSKTEMFPKSISTSAIIQSIWMSLKRIAGRQIMK